MKYEIAVLPHQLKDEDKWFGLTKSQWKILGPIALIVILFLKFSFEKGFGLVGLIISVVVVAISLILVLVKVPEYMYLYGAGQPLYVPIKFFVFSKLKKKTIVYAKFDSE